MSTDKLLDQIGGQLKEQARREEIEEALHQLDDSDVLTLQDRLRGADSGADVDLDGLSRKALEVLKEQLEQLEGPTGFEQLQEAVSREASRWERRARANQLPPEGDWFVWLLRAGRGFGKTRSGAEWFHRRALERKRWMALIGKTPGDVRDDCVEGPGGILQNTPPGVEVDYEPSKRRLTWPNGTYATIFSGANPDQIRGFSGDTAWLDEFAAWQKPRRAWQNITLALREGDDPRCCITTTPRPLKVLEEIEEQNGTEVVTGSSFENRDNLSERYYEQVIEPLESTEKGRQEIYAEYIDATGDLWDWDMIEHAKEGVEPVGDMTRIVVAVDPAATSNEDSDETGIIVVAEGTDDRFYVLEDCSLKNTPGEWTREAVNAYQRHEADRVIAETNNGGDMVETIMRNQQENIPYDSVRATRGKVVRAEPVAVMYEQQNVKHVQAFPELEEQMVHFQQNGGESPDRLDALVWGLTYLTQEGDTGSGGVARLLWP